MDWELTDLWASKGLHFLPPIFMPIPARRQREAYPGAPGLAYCILSKRLLVVMQEFGFADGTGVEGAGPLLGGLGGKRP